MFAITDFAMKSDKRHGMYYPLPSNCQILVNIADRVEHEPGMWNDLKNNFVEQLDQVNADLKAAGLPPVAKGQ